MVLGKDEKINRIRTLDNKSTIIQFSFIGQFTRQPSTTLGG